MHPGWALAHEELTRHFGALWSSELYPFNPDAEASSFRYAPFDIDHRQGCDGRRTLLVIEEAAADGLTVRVTEEVEAGCGSDAAPACARETLHTFTLRTACTLGTDCPAYPPDVRTACE